MWAPTFGGGPRGRKPSHNCGASPTPKAGLEAVPLPLGVAGASCSFLGPFEVGSGQILPAGPGFGAGPPGGAGPQPEPAAAGWGLGFRRLCRWGSSSHSLPDPAFTPHSILLGLPFPTWPHHPTLPNSA